MLSDLATAQNSPNGGATSTASSKLRPRPMSLHSGIGLGAFS